MIISLQLLFTTQTTRVIRFALTQIRYKSKVDKFAGSYHGRVWVPLGCSATMGKGVAFNACFVLHLCPKNSH